MLSEEYDFKPANHSCSTIIHPNLLVINPGTKNEATMNNINALQQQHLEDSKYDQTDEIIVKPLYGGNLNNYKINFKKKNININAYNEIEAIQNLLNNKVYKKENLLEITDNNNNKSLYVIKTNKKKNNLKKIF